MSLLNRNYIVILLTVLLQACGPGEEDYDQLVTITTNKGSIKLLLFDDTPRHKASFLELAEAGAYDSTKFYRVMKEFMIQGGDLSENPEFEKESRRLIPAEILPNHFNARGMLGAARQPTSANPYKQSSTQFYIVQGRVFSEEELRTDLDQLNASVSKYLYGGSHEDLIAEFKALQDSGKTDELQNRILEIKPEIEAELGMSFENTEITEEQIISYATLGGAPHLDGGYTVFGQVVEGLDVVDKIGNLPVDGKDNPLEPVNIVITVEDVLRDSLSAWYGITYPDSL